MHDVVVRLWQGRHNEEGEVADPLLMPLLEYLAQNLVTWRLYGHLRDLRAGTEFVGERTPTRQQVLPMPPARQKGKNPGY